MQPETVLVIAVSLILGGVTGVGLGVLWGLNRKALRKAVALLDGAVICSSSDEPAAPANNRAKGRRRGIAISYTFSGASTAVAATVAAAPFLLSLRPRGAGDVGEVDVRTGEAGVRRRRSSSRAAPAAVAREAPVGADPRGALAPRSARRRHHEGRGPAHPGRPDAQPGLDPRRARGASPASPKGCRRRSTPSRRRRKQQSRIG